MANFGLFESMLRGRLGEYSDDRLRVEIVRFFKKKFPNANQFQIHRLKQFLKTIDDKELRQQLQLIQDPTAKLCVDPEDTEKLVKVDTLAKVIRAGEIKKLRKDIILMHLQIHIDRPDESQNRIRKILSEMSYEQMQQKYRELVGFLKAMQDKGRITNFEIDTIADNLNNLFGGR